jgi:hypothetical protein
MFGYLLLPQLLLLLLQIGAQSGPLSPFPANPPL